LPTLKKRGIVIGLIAHTCVEATVRFAAEFGYDLTVVRDATADYSDEYTHAALDVNLPSYANVVVTTSEVVEALSIQLRLTESLSATNKRYGSTRDN
jgi:ureidoacrylate peracid hydrolase